MVLLDSHDDLATRRPATHTSASQSNPALFYMGSAEDPFSAIAGDTPAFSEAVAIELVRERYAMQVDVEPLVSERDQNFSLRSADGRRYVLKIANAAEQRLVTEFQIDALLHIENHVTEHATPIRTPTILRTTDGASHTVLRGPAGEHVVRIVSFVAGTTIGERVPTARLCRSMGTFLAYLGQTLRDFRHAGSNQTLLWDLQQALSLRDLTRHIPTEAVRRDVVQALDDYEEFVLPGFGSVRHQVIHSDFNPDNVLTDSALSETVTGVIDFGDMLAAPLIADVAIGASYARPRHGDPLALMTEYLAAYHHVTPLVQEEVDMLFDLVKARLCASVAILYWRASFREPGDPYLQKLLNAESFAEHFLAKLAAIPRDHALRTFRQVCASQDIQSRQPGH